MPVRVIHKIPGNQKGLVLLALVIVIMLAFVTYSLSDLSITQVHMDKSENTLVTLKEAKQAVINYAVTYSDRGVDNDYGVFPHPETIKNGDYGNMPGNVGTKNTNVIGWFPWRALDLPALNDESGTCLFYAVSGTYKLGGTVQADMINEDSIGMFQIVDDSLNILQGANIEDRVVALVIAPGGPLPGQVRNPLVPESNCGDDYGNIGAYLEGDGVTDNSFVSAVADTVDFFIHATETSDEEAVAYNDKFLTITRDEVWKAIVNRSDFKQDMETLTRALAVCASKYANLSDNAGRRLPWPAKVNLGVTIDYRVDANYNDDSAAEGYSGRYPFLVDDSNNDIDPINLTEDSLFEIAGLCNNLGNDWEGEIIDLEGDSSKYRQLWNNWKDHFFFMISKSYEPDNTGIEKVCTDAGTSCITVNATEYAGAVIFSGSRLAGFTRNDKALLTEYLEDGKSTEFADEITNKTGDRTYVYTDPQTDTVNDVMYCIQDQPMGTPLDVIECL